MTMDELQAHIARPEDKPYKPVARVVCADGLTLSVQAGESLYCSPRENGADYYDQVEVGFPSRPLPELGDDDNSDVYAYVPVERVLAVINAAGGQA